jgi:hypothetical protein
MAIETRKNGQEAPAGIGPAPTAQEKAARAAFNEVLATYFTVVGSWVPPLDIPLGEYPEDLLRQSVLDHLNNGFAQEAAQKTRH